MKRILLQLVFFSFVGGCLAQAPATKTDPDPTSKVITKITEVQEALTKYRDTLEKIKKRLDDESLKEKTKDTICYLSLRDNTLLKVYKDNKPVKNKPKIDDSEEGRFKHIYITGIHIFIRADTVRSVTVYYNGKTKTYDSINKSLPDFLNSFEFDMDDNQKIKLQDLINYEPRNSGTILDVTVILTNGKRRQGLIKK